MRTILDRLKDRYERGEDPVVCHVLADGIATTVRQRDLLAHAEGYARMYRGVGVRRGSPVPIVLRHSADMLHAFVGAMLCGAVPAFLAPISEKQAAERYWPALRELLRRVEAGALVVGRADRAALERHVDVAGLPLLTPEDCAPAATAPVWPIPAPDDIAFLQFSSGTTGLRKGVMLRHDQVAVQLDALRRALNLDDGDCIASWLPLYHDMGLIACMVMPLALGIPFVLLDPFEWAHRPGMLLRAIERYRASHVWLPNFAFNHLTSGAAEDERYDLGSIKAVINCSEPCKAESMRRFARRFAGMGIRPDLLQVSYAMAEAVFAVTQTPPGQPVPVLRVDRSALAANGRAVPCEDPDGIELVSTGRPVAGIELSIVDADGAPCCDGAVGEIVIRGASVFSGYYKSADETASAFRDGWFQTGDLGFRLDGELYVTGRRKDLLICHGKNFYAHDIEALVGEVSGVKPGRAVAFGLHNEVSGSEDVVVVLESTLPEGPERQALPRRVKSAVLGGINLTVSKVFVAPPRWLAKTTSGKISRRENRDRYLRLAAEGLRKAG